ncbi:MAG: hypothetical protein ABIQ18_05535 [Umezawaea sp.]
MIDQEPLSSGFDDVRTGQERPVRKTITLHDRSSAATNSVALLPPRVAVPVPPDEVPLPLARAEVPRRGAPRTLGLLVVFGGLAAVIVTAFGVTGVLMLIGLCVALRLMWTDRAGR